MIAAVHPIEEANGRDIIARYVDPFASIVDPIFNLEVG